MKPPCPVIDLRSRDWRTQLKAALDATFGDVAKEPTPQCFHDTLRGLK